METTGHYTRTAVLLHWLIAAALIAELVLGWWMQGVPKTPPGVRAGWFNLHKSVGLAVMVLVVVRLAWRATHRPPAEDALPAWQRLASHANHALLYVGMAALPLTGYLGSAFSGYPVKFFGWTLPAWHGEWAQGKAFMANAHEAISWVLVVCVSLHVAAVGWHLLRRDGMAGRMALR